MSSCLGRASVPVKRVWRGLNVRLGRRHRRRTVGDKLSTSSYAPVTPDQYDDYDDMEGVLFGLGRLRKDVRTCEYHDVHVMWEMLSGGGDRVGGGSRDDDMDEGKGGGAPAKTRRTRRKPAPWSRLVAYCCAF